MRGREDDAPPGPFRAVAFDLDGLMFDTEALYCQVVAAQLQARGKVFTPEIRAAMLGHPWPVAGPILQTMAGLDESMDDFRTETRERFRARMDSAVHPTPGLFPLLAHLTHRGLPCAVATSSRREYAERLLRSHHLLDRFAFTLTAEDVTRSKPDPEIYLKAAARFGITPAQMLVLEDSPAGLGAAKAAGAFAVGIPHEHSPVEAISAADLIVPRLDDPALLQLLS